MTDTHCEAKKLDRQKKETATTTASTTLTFRPPEGPLLSNFMLWVRTATAELLFVTFHAPQLFPNMLLKGGKEETRWLVAVVACDWCGL